MHVGDDLDNTGGWNQIINLSTNTTLEDELSYRDNVKSNWNESDATSYAYILNKPEIPNDNDLLHVGPGNYVIEKNIGIDEFDIFSANIYSSNIYDNNGNPTELLGRLLVNNDDGNGEIILEDDGNTGFIQIKRKKGNTTETLQEALNERNNIQADWNETSYLSYAYILNKPTISTTVVENDTNAVSGGAVYSKIEDLIGTAPSALDTLGEIAYALNNDANLAGTLTTQIDSKIPKVQNPTTGNFVTLTSYGTLVDSGYSHSDYLTSQTQADWEEDDSTSAAYIQNKPVVSAIIFRNWLE